MIPRSIRWRLPLSYAAVATLGVLALGLVLFLTLRQYYRGQELDYLKSNAAAIGSSLGILIQAEVPSQALQPQVDTFSFLTQTRVRLLDTNDQALADSGDPRVLNEAATVSLDLEIGRLSQELTQTVEGPDRARKYTSVITFAGEGTEAVGAEVDVQLEQTVVIEGATDERLASILADEGLVEEPALVSLILGIGPQLGLPSAQLNSPRSGTVVRHLVRDPLGNTVGYVELSEGPAIGRDVLISVAWGWAISGGVAVVLAVGAGLLISRRLSTPLLSLTEVTTRMAEGDLAARASVSRSDELGRLGSAFNVMASRVEETIVTLRRFVADAAHQLNTPLTALGATVDLLADEADSTRRRVMVERACAQVDRLEQMSKGLLDLSRIESSGGQEALGAVDLASLVRETSEHYASQAEQAEVTFALQIAGEIPMIPGNANQIRQAVENLLDNALKFTPRHGAVAVALSHESRWVVVTVDDTGIGIEQDEIPRLFDRFNRGRNASDYPGSGLGLAIVKAVVEGHGGHVSAERTSAGTRFTVMLPDTTA